MRFPSARPWQAFLACGSAVAVAFLIVPPAAGAVLLFGIGLASIVAVGWGIRRYRPPHPRGWLLLAAAQAVWLIADAAWGLLGLGSGRLSEVSAVDWVYLAGYPLAAIGLASVTAGRRRPEWTSLADAAIITLAVGVVAWVVLLSQAAGTAGLDPMQRTVTIAYRLAHLALLAAILPVLVSPRQRSAAVVLLGLSLFVMVAGDIAWMVATVRETRGQSPEALDILGFAFWGAAALHPSMAGPADRRRVSRTRLTALRLVVLIAAMCVPVVVISFSLHAGLSPESGIVATVAFIGITTLAVARISAIARDHARAEDRYRGLVDQLDAVVFSVDTVAGTSVVSRHAEVVLGYPVERLQQDDFPRAIIVDEDLDRVDRARRDQAGPDTYELEYRVRRGDGQVIWINERVRRIRDATGRVIKQNGVAYDITERRRLEDAIERSQRLEAVGRLAGGVAHDFNNLLMVITGTAETLADRLEPGDPAREDVDMIMQAGERASRLTRQLLAVGRRSPLRLGAVQLRDVLADIGPMIARTLAADVELHLELGTDHDQVRVDRGRLEQVVVNLALNACDAMPGGGVLTLRASTEEVTPEVLAAHPKACTGRIARITVTDTGHGIPADVLPHLFEPFFTTKPFGEGSGLGLASVDGIVAQNGGWIDVETVVGGGTAFTLSFPCIPESDAA